MGLRAVTNLEFLAHMWGSWGLSTALFDCKVHVLITAVVFCSNLGPETVKLPHLLSIFNWETNLHFPSDPKLVWSWVSGSGSVSWLFPPGLSIKSVLSICDWMDGLWSNVRPHASNHKCHTRYSCTIWPREHREFYTLYFFTVHFKIIVISVMLKVNISNTAKSKYIFLPNRGNEVSVRL